MLASEERAVSWRSGHHSHLARDNNSSSSKYETIVLELAFIYDFDTLNVCQRSHDGGHSRVKLKDWFLGEAKSTQQNGIYYDPKPISFEILGHLCCLNFVASSSNIYFLKSRLNFRPVGTKLILGGLRLGASEERKNGGPGACPRETFS